MTNSERTLEKRRRYKARIVQTMGGKCQCCVIVIMMEH